MIFSYSFKCHPFKTYVCPSWSSANKSLCLHKNMTPELEHFETISSLSYWARASTWLVSGKFGCANWPIIGRVSFSFGSKSWIFHTFIPVSEAHITLTNSSSRFGTTNRIGATNYVLSTTFYSFQDFWAGYRTLKLTRIKAIKMNELDSFWLTHTPSGDLKMTFSGTCNKHIIRSYRMTELNCVHIHGPFFRNF